MAEFKFRNENGEFVSMPTLEGRGILNVKVENNHLIVTYKDGTVEDAGTISGGGSDCSTSPLRTYYFEKQKLECFSTVYSRGTIRVQFAVGYMNKDLECKPFDYFVDMFDFEYQVPADGYERLVPLDVIVPTMSYFDMTTSHGEQVDFMSVAEMLGSSFSYYMFAGYGDGTNSKAIIDFSFTIRDNSIFTEEQLDGLAKELGNSDGFILTWMKPAPSGFKEVS